MQTAVQTPDAEGGSSRRPALARCLDVPVEQFATEHWGRRPLLSHTDGFADLFGPEAVDEIVATRGLRTPFLRMAREGRVLGSDAFTAAGGVGATVTDQADPVAVAALLTDGATLVLQALHRTWPALGEFARSLTDDLGHPVQVNAYITPPASQGFAGHYDTHDVFVLQISGQKAWTVHEPVLDHPLPHQTWEQRSDEVAARATDEPAITTQLGPGDSLYLPRGWVHSAQAQQDVSVHLTVGIHTVDRADVARALLERALAVDPALRTSLPLGAATDGDLASTAASVAALLAAALPDVPPQDVAADLAGRFAGDRAPEPVFPLRQLAVSLSATQETPVRLRAGLRPTLVSRDGRTRVTAAGRYVEASDRCADALRVLCSGRTVRAATLPDVAPDTALALVRRALREGIVVADDD